MYLLRWALFLLVFSCIAALLGFTGLAEVSADIAKWLFFIFLVTFVLVILLVIGALGAALFRYVASRRARSQ